MPFLDAKSLRTLDAAILGQALLDLRGKDLQDAEEAGKWFLGAWPEHLFSFPRICQRAGLRRAGTRRGLEKVFERLSSSRREELRLAGAFPREKEKVYG